MIKIGTSGFRGIDGVDIDETVVAKIALATANIIRKRGFRREIFVGYDYRKTSLKYAYILTNALTKNGILCHFMRGGVSSSMISYLCRVEGLDLSIMVTSSHNPYSYNGIKIFSKGGQDLDSSLEESYNNELENIKDASDVDIDTRQVKADVHQGYYEDKYISSLTRNIAVDKGLKIAVDTMHGSSRRLMRKLVNALKIEAEVIDSMEIAHKTFSAPIPSRENMSCHGELIRKNRLDFTFATDGDGDRMAFIFDDLSYHDASDVAPLLYYFLVREKGKTGPLVCNYSFSKLGEMTAQNVGEKCIESRIGFKHIGGEMIENNALMGCENSSLAYSPHTPYKDGLVALVLMCELVSHYRQPISKIMADFKRKMGYDLNYFEASYHFDEIAKRNKRFNENDSTILSYVDMLHFTPQVNDEKLLKVGTLDGYKYFFTTTTVLIRQSGTENVIRIVVESTKDASLIASSVLSQFAKFAEALIRFN